MEGWTFRIGTVYGSCWGGGEMSVSWFVKHIMTNVRELCYIRAFHVFIYIKQLFNYLIETWTSLSITICLIGRCVM